MSLTRCHDERSPTPFRTLHKLVTTVYLLNLFARAPREVLSTCVRRRPATSHLWERHCRHLARMPTNKQSDTIQALNCFLENNFPPLLTEGAQHMLNEQTTPRPVHYFRQRTTPCSCILICPTPPTPTLTPKKHTKQYYPPGAPTSHPHCRMNSKLIRWLKRQGLLH